MQPLAWGRYIYMRSVRIWLLPSPVTYWESANVTCLRTFAAISEHCMLLYIGIEHIEAVVKLQLLLCVPRQSACHICKVLHQSETQIASLPALQSEVGPCCCAACKAGTTLCCDTLVPLQLFHQSLHTLLSCVLAHQEQVYATHRRSAVIVLLR